MNLTLQSEWERYEREVLPSIAGPVQRKQSRRAFYAGAVVLMTINKDIGNRDLSEDAALAVLTGIDDEIRQFYKDCCEGKA